MLAVIRQRRTFPTIQPAETGTRYIDQCEDEWLNWPVLSRNIFILILFIMKLHSIIKNEQMPLYKTT